MFSKNLKYYRLRKNLSKRKLAELAGVSPMAITHYENGSRKPEIDTIKKLADVLGVKPLDFLARRNENLVFHHRQFRKNSSLKLQQQDFVYETVEEYFSRFYDVVELLGGDVLPKAPKTHILPLTQDVETDAKALREYLKISEYGPVGNLIGLLENHGILVSLLPMEDHSFSGINGRVNDRPYIVINGNITPERIRTTICHELAHCAFEWPSSMTEKDEERYATAIAGAFLFPYNDAVRELGYKRHTITKDMYMVCEEYGISLSLLVVRAHICGIINDSLYNSAFRIITRNADTRITNEYTTLFEQLVYRAVNEHEITIQRGAELLKKPYDVVAQNCESVEVLH